MQSLAHIPCRLNIRQSLVNLAVVQYDYYDETKCLEAHEMELQCCSQPTHSSLYQQVADICQEWESAVAEVEVAVGHQTTRDLKQRASMTVNW